MHGSQVCVVLHRYGFYQYSDRPIYTSKCQPISITDPIFSSRVLRVSPWNGHFVASHLAAMFAKEDGSSNPAV